MTEGPLAPSVRDGLAASYRARGYDLWLLQARILGRILLLT